MSYPDNLGVAFKNPLAQNGIFSIPLLALESSNNENLQKGSTQSSPKEWFLIAHSLSLQNSTSETNVTNPCYPRNYVTTFTAGHLFDSLCTEDLRPGGYDPDHVITFEGSGDPSLCRVKVASLFAFKACREQEVCCFDGVYQPKVKGSFVVRAKTTERFLFSPIESLFLTFVFLSCRPSPTFFLPALKCPSSICSENPCARSAPSRLSRASSTQPALSTSPAAFR